MLVQTIRRVLRTPQLRRRSAQGHLNLIRTDTELDQSAVLLADHGQRNRVLIQHLLRQLWSLDTTALYVQVDNARPRTEVVVTPRSGHLIVASGQKFRVEAQTHEPAPNGAYLVAKQYRQLGFYEHPPAERAIVVARVRAGTGTVYLVDTPDYVRHVTVLINDRILANAAIIPDRGDIRCALPATAD